MRRLRFPRHGPPASRTTGSGRRETKRDHGQFGARREGIGRVPCRGRDEPGPDRARGPAPGRLPDRLCQRGVLRVDRLRLGRDRRSELSLSARSRHRRTAVARIRKAISARWNVCEEIVNYRKDGSTFWNALFVNPVFDQGGKLVYIFGTQLDVTRRRALEGGLQRSNELLSVIRLGVAAALALQMSDVQRRHLEMALSATSEAAGCHEALLQTRSGSGP